ncbi:MAG: hypothetical protein OHK0039_19970 [Bacteroidia bacterium]
MTIAIDFDGVLHGYSRGRQDGSIYDPPVPGASEALKALKAQGHKIYIFTTRTNKIYRKNDPIDHEQAIKDWLAQHDIPYDRIWNFGKPMADIYIDDRALGFRGDWAATLGDIATFKVWNQADDPA